MAKESEKSAGVVWKVCESASGWHWESYDRAGNQIGRSMSFFASERSCLENAAFHGMAIPWDRGQGRDMLDDPPIDEAAIRANIRMIEIMRAETQRLSPAGLSDGSTPSYEHQGNADAPGQKAYYTYIVASRSGDALIVKMDLDLPRLLLERRNKSPLNGSPEDKAETIVWFEMHRTIEDATLRQKTVQKWPRQRKIGFVDALNPEWADLSHQIRAP